MPQKKDNLPVKVDVDLQNGGTISYANEVIATIAGVAVNEIDGIAGMSVASGISDIWSRNKNITRGVKVELGGQEAAVDLYIIVEYGKPIQKVAAEVQENVRRALESLTGLHVVRVDVHVQGVSFEKEKQVNQSSLEASRKAALTQPESPAAEQQDSVSAEPAEAPSADALQENAPEEAEEQTMDSSPEQAEETKTTQHDADISDEDVPEAVQKDNEAEPEATQETVSVSDADEAAAVSDKPDEAEEADSASADFTPDDASEEEKPETKKAGSRRKTVRKTAPEATEDLEENPDGPQRKPLVGRKRCNKGEIV